MQKETLVVQPAIKPPVAFRPPNPPPYVKEPEDSLVPDETWLSDFVESMRGIETPTIFCYWSALWAISAASCRLSYLNWLEEDPLFPNLYVFLVAPPGRCRKSTSILWASKVLRGLHNKFDQNTFDDNFLAYLTKFNWATSKTTPDSIYELLLPQESQIVTPTEMGVGHKGSQLTVAVSELTTFMNRKKFNTGLIETLTELYDCQKEIEIRTLVRGEQKLEDIYITMIAAVTPTGMKKSLPEEAFGEGFMSRVIITSRDKTLRRFERPVRFAGFPTLDTLRERLAYIVRKGRGEYDLSPAAGTWYKAWYNRWRDQLDSDDDYLNRTAEFRMEVIILRIALLIRMSRYGTSKTVEVEDLEYAKRLLETTYSQSKLVTDEVADSLFSATYRTVAGYIQRKADSGAAVERRALIQYMSSKKIPAKEVDSILGQLMEEGHLKPVNGNGSLTKGTKNESYIWVTTARRIEPSKETYDD